MATADRLAQQFIGKRFFYGWIIVLITFSTAMTTAGISGYGLSFFIVPMSDELGISRTQFSAIAVFRVALLPLLPFLGLLVDKKHGPRILITVGSILSGIVLMSTSLVQELWQFYLLYGVVFGLAMFAMGGQLVGPAVISKWFIRKRGRAMAIGTMGISTGGFIIAPMAGWFVGEFGWRTAWVLLGIFLMLAITPMAALFMRRQPEDIGLLPDGEEPGGASGGGAGRGAAQEEYPWTVKEAFRTRTLWIMLLVQSFGSMGLMPVIFHQVAYIQDKDFSLATATAVAATVAFFAIVAKPIWGLVTERIHVRWVVPMCVIPAGVSLFALIVAQDLTMLYVYAIFHGLTMGGWPTIANVAWASYFGRQHQGAIRGFVTPIGNVMGAASPVLGGYMWDRYGTYDLAFLVFGMAWIVAGLLMLMAAPPKPPAKADAGGQQLAAGAR